MSLTGVLNERVPVALIDLTAVRLQRSVSAMGSKCVVYVVDVLRAVNKSPSPRCVGCSHGGAP